jgi:hypothetical protein
LQRQVLLMIAMKNTLIAKANNEKSGSLFMQH